jgi:hypothetical protein
MMQNIDEDRRKQEERLAKIDPKKAAQAERLGLGMGSVVGGGAKSATTGAAHSIASGIVDVQQEGVRSTKPAAAARAAYDGKGPCVDRMHLNLTDYGYGKSRNTEKFYDARDTSDDGWTAVVAVDREPTSKKCAHVFLWTFHLVLFLVATVGMILTRKTQRPTRMISLILGRRTSTLFYHISRLRTQAGQNTINRRHEIVIETDDSAEFCCDSACH